MEGTYDVSEDVVVCPRNPRQDAGGLSRLTVWWMNRLFRKAFNRPLEPRDMYEIIPGEICERQAGGLSKIWQRLSTQEKKKSTSLLKSLFRSVMGLLSLTVFLTFLSELSKFIQPIFIGILVGYFTGDSRISREVAYGCGCGLILANLVYDFLFTTQSFLYQLVAMRMRTACIGVLYRKVLRMSNMALAQQNTGNIVNLLATDIEKFHMGLTTLQGVVVGPFVFIALSFILGFEVGVAAVPGIIFILILLLLRLSMGKAIGRLRSLIASWADKRLSLQTEIIKSMRMVKMHCWEKPFSVRARKLRRQEMEAARKQMLYIGANLILGYLGPKLTVYCIMLTLVLLENKLTPQIAVKVVMWVRVSEFLLFVMLPLSMGTLYQMVVSIKRIQDFLLSDEKVEPSSVFTPTDIVDPSAPKVALYKACATWRLVEPLGLGQDSETPILRPAGAAHPDEGHRETRKNAPILLRRTALEVEAGEEQFSLSNISLRAEKTDLLAIVGPVGSGKSSLLMTLLGDLPLTSGDVQVRGRVAYVPQQPWLVTDTLEENILMGRPKNVIRYSRVIKACELHQDIRAMPHGDQTVIGERGLTLSGGQKARINLARAVYHDADIYILDDPLSAVDVQVGNRLFQNVICGLLNKSIRILVTHQTQHLHSVSKIVVLDQGKVTFAGTHSEVTARVNLQRTISIDTPHQRPSSKLFRVRPTSWTQASQRSRTSSYSSITDIPLPEGIDEEPFDETVPTKADHALAGEEKATRAVSASTYRMYFRSGKGALLLPVILLLGCAYEAAGVFAEWWTSEWYNRNLKRGANESLSVESSGKWPGSSTFGSNRHTLDVFIYTAAMVVYLLGCLAQGIVLSLMVWFAARNIYKRMFNVVMGAPLHFFERNPIGRILNRFARDTGFVDERLLLPVFLTFGLALGVLANVVYTCVINPWALLATVPFAVCVLLLRHFAIPAIRDIKRIEGMMRTPTFSHMSAILDGMTVIRAFKMERHMLTKADSYIDAHTSTWYLYLSAQRWFQLRLLLLSTVYFAAVVLLAVALPGQTSGGGALGLSLTYIFSLMVYVQEVMRWATELETYMTSVERVNQYSALEQEGSGEQEMDVPDDWPTSGEIRFQGVRLVYPGSELPILDNIDFHICPREKVGIVGRTGAGKSSLFTALLRLVEPGGRITIDGIDIKNIGLTDLRRSVSVIPQDPIMFSGTLRDNLDPFGDYKTHAIWEALEQVQLKEPVGHLPGNLEYIIAEGGANFSVGQRQLLCMARALLQGNRIIVIDEATANVDNRTDALIQRAMREQFSECTVLNIAHRLHTIIKCDRIMVLDQGRLINFDHPHVLIENRGVFFELVQQTGAEEAANLATVAKNRYENS